MTNAGMFSEQHEVQYTAEDFRFTCTDDAVYATALGWPESTSTIKTMNRLNAGEISSVTMLGSNQELTWNLSEKGLEVNPPDVRPGKHAFVYKITRKNPF